MTLDDLTLDNLKLKEVTCATYCCGSDGKRSKTEYDVRDAYPTKLQNWDTKCECREVILQMTIQTKARYVYPIRQPI
jgi:hypothetical protein